jgi:peroxiredoxin
MRLVILALLVLMAGCASARGRGDIDDSDLDIAQEVEELEADREPCENPETTCPPTGPFGGDLGNQLPDLQLADCDGQTVSLHELCGANAGLIYHFYGWCASCFDFVRGLNDLYDSHHPRGLKILMIVAEDPLQQPATLEYCQALRDTIGLQVRMVYDPDGSFAPYGGAGYAIVIAENTEIVFKRDDATTQAVITAIALELSNTACADK